MFRKQLNKFRRQFAYEGQEGKQTFRVGQAVTFRAEIQANSEEEAINLLQTWIHNVDYDDNTIYDLEGNAVGHISETHIEY